MIVSKKFLSKKIMKEIYTDGACKGNPGKGGWGIIIYDGNKRTKVNGGAEKTTNNRMELMAIIKALVYNKNEPCIIYTDSQYVKKGITDWMINWKKNGWKKKTKPHEIINVDLWKQIDEKLTKHVKVEWVKAHVGIEGNEIADELANRAIERLF